MQVVEDQHERFRRRREHRADARDTGRPDRLAGGRERLEHRVGDVFDAAQRRRHVAQQHDRVVVARVQGDRRERSLVPLGPVGQQRGLAETGGRDHAHHASARRAHAIGQRGLRHGVGAQGGRRELRLDQIKRELCRRHRIPGSTTLSSRSRGDARGLGDRRHHPIRLIDRTNCRQTSVVGLERRVHVVAQSERELRRSRMWLAVRRSTRSRRRAWPRSRLRWRRRRVPPRRRGRRRPGPRRRPPWR